MGTLIKGFFLKRMHYTFEYATSEGENIVDVRNMDYDLILTFYPNGEVHNSLGRIGTIREVAGSWQFVVPKLSDGHPATDITISPFDGLLWYGRFNLYEAVTAYQLHQTIPEGDALERTLHLPFAISSPAVALTVDMGEEGTSFLITTKPEEETDRVEKLGYTVTEITADIASVINQQYNGTAVLSTNML